FLPYRAQIEQAIDTAPRGNRSAAYIAELKSDLFRSFGGAVGLEANKRARSGQRISPHFRDVSLSPEEAQSRMRGRIVAWIDDMRAYWCDIEDNKDARARWEAAGCPPPASRNAFPYPLIFTVAPRTIVAAETSLGKTHATIESILRRFDLRRCRIYFF